MTLLDFSAPSSDGIHTLRGRVYLPAGYPEIRPRGLFHVVHGMTEYIGRYDRFLTAMADAGYIACGYDHLGHGHTVSDASELGYIAPKKGYELLARDVAVFSAAVRAAYDPTPDKTLSYFLLGHSMGSFVVRYSTAQGYVCPDRLIIMGTGGPTPAAGVGLALMRTVKLFKGGRHISPMIDRLAFGGYNAHFTEDDPHAWLNSSKEGRDLYRNDPLCTYKFTVSAMCDLVTLTAKANARAWFKALPAGMPVLLVSGRDDPVGDWGKGVETVRDRLLAAGVPTTCHIYEGARHEILNDFTYEQVLADILVFLTT